MLDVRLLLFDKLGFGLVIKHQCRALFLQVCGQSKRSPKSLRNLEGGFDHMRFEFLPPINDSGTHLHVISGDKD
ncbi:hypothetical protein WL74_33265 [Burkholderia cepacia]|nr:hypothetical protein WL74_33265 [Burkholderia cepacia]